MGLFDLPAPLFEAADRVAGMVLPPGLRLVLWGVLAGWLTMVVYRRLSNQERIGELKRELKAQQQRIANFDGEFDELLPLIRHSLGLGLRQLGLALGPAVLASIPALFLIAWVAGQFGYQQPGAGERVRLTTSPATATLEFPAQAAARASGPAWEIAWPAPAAGYAIAHAGVTVLELPTEAAVPVKHPRLWWNWLFANPLGYLEADAGLERIELALEPQRFLPFGPGWMRGWMFGFFFTFLVASVAFKLLLRID